MIIYEVLTGGCLFESNCGMVACLKSASGRAFPMARCR